MKTLTILANDEIVYEADREQDLVAGQFEFLDNMDRSMESGIKLNGELISQPDVRQRATFVAMNLLKALQQDNAAMDDYGYEMIIHDLIEVPFSHLT